MALAAVDTALWDIRCKAAGQPLWLLAGGYRERVPLYDTEGGWLNIPIDEIVAELAAADATLESLLVAVATSDVFRMRRGEE